MPARFRPYAAIVAALVIIVAVAVIVKVNADRSAPVARPGLAQSERKGGQPNILVVMTDDQTLEAMRVLDNVDRLIVDQGTSFTNYAVSFPNCCPSRATTLTGQFAHNDNVRDNVAPRGGFHQMDKDENLPIWLQRAGYYTAGVGKYLNEWGQNGIIDAPVGWTHWFGLIDPTTYHYYGYSVSNDGVRQDYGHDPKDYSTDVLGGEVVRIISERAAQPDPWFVMWTPLAPHAQEGETASGEATGDQGDNENKTIIEKLRATLPEPAPEFKGKMSKENLPKPPSFNQDDVSKLPNAFQKRFKMTFDSQGLVREGYQRELEALQSVDKWVGRIFDTLSRTNQLDDTVVIFTSDNGFFHGEHRITFSKVYLYEPAVHLPLVIRGAGFPKAAKNPAIVGNVDLAPTILRLAAGNTPSTLDGRDLAAVAKDPSLIEGRGMLLENWTDSGKKHTDGIRTSRYKYLVNQDHEEEIYDLQKDPDEIVNLAYDPPHFELKAQLVERLNQLRTCSGKTCEGADPPTPATPPTTTPAG
jgi:N-acetylglucosamine-6-sulfatase